MNRKTGASIAAHAMSTIPIAHRHPSETVSCAIAGTKISWPALVAAPKAPMIIPRCVRNHRYATAAPSTPPTAPVPSPIGEAPEQVHLPDIADEDETHEADDDQEVSHQHHATRSVAVVQRPAERPAQSEGEDAERDRERDLGSRPAEFRLEWRDDHARRRAHRLRREERKERDDDNDPCVVEALHGWSKV